MLIGGGPIVIVALSIAPHGLGAIGGISVVIGKLPITVLA